MMKKFNEVTLNITVAIIDFLYRGRDYPRFWVLEEIPGTLFCIFERPTFKGIFRSPRTRASILDERTLCSESE